MIPTQSPTARRPTRHLRFRPWPFLWSRFCQRSKPRLRSDPARPDARIQVKPEARPVPDMPQAVGPVSGSDRPIAMPDENPIEQARPVQGDAIRKGDMPGNGGAPSNPVSRPDARRIDSAVAPIHGQSPDVASTVSVRVAARADPDSQCPASTSRRVGQRPRRKFRKPLHQKRQVVRRSGACPIRRTEVKRHHWSARPKQRRLLRYAGRMSNRVAPGKGRSLRHRSLPVRWQRCPSAARRRHRSPHRSRTEQYLSRSRIARP